MAAMRELFAPFRHRIFLAIWVASLFSNFGSLIQAVGASWMMTSMSVSADMVALVQASTSLPIMLFSLFAGAIADVWDRRLVMLVAQTLMLVVSAALAIIAFMGLVTPWLLLGLTFLLGCGTALHGPAWQSSVGEQVPRSDLPGAVALNSMGFNLARAVGPAIGGLVVASAGPQVAFMLNAVTYVGLIVVLVGWKRPRVQRTLPPEGVLSAMSAGLRYGRLSPQIRVVLLRVAVLTLLTAAIWSLMPLVARDLLGGDSLIYGILLGSFGAGAVVGAVVSGTVRRRLANETVLRCAILIFAIASVVIGVSSHLWMSIAALLVAGMAWVLALSNFNVIVQLSSPRWVVGRSMAVYQMTAFAGVALGSWLWGHLAEQAGLPATFAVAGVLLLASILIGLRVPLPSSEALKLEPTEARAHPTHNLDILPRSGPVVTAIEYRIPEERLPEFLKCMRELRVIRRRDGGYNWHLLRDIADPDLWTERFESATWLALLRLRERSTVADQELLARIVAMHAGDEPPRRRHMLERPPAALAQLESGAEHADAASASTDPNLPASRLNP